MLLNLGHAGWKPLSDTHDFVEWAPREYNVVADHAANATMDCGIDWKIENSQGIAEAKATGERFRICSDGGRRSGSLAAAGVAIYSVDVVDGCARCTELVRAGKQVQSIESAFLAEAVSLEWALDLFLEL